MPDYAACQNVSCPRRGECGRYRMIWSGRQSVGGFSAEGCTAFVSASTAPFRVHTAEEADAIHKARIEKMTSERP